MSIQQDLLAQVKAWRQAFHQRPELGFQEHTTAGVIADRLRAMGIEVTEGVGQTGVVGTLRRGAGKSIGLRADMDALPIVEANTFAHRSQNHQCMHACGHDGHTAMLLGAAQYLSQSDSFAGTVQFIFQPAEEALGGAQVMLDDGLLTRFPVDELYGLHNWPGLPLGQVAVNNGAMMASFDTFEITLQGRGTHAAMPEQGLDPIVAAASLIMGLQTIVSRRVSPLGAAVVSVTQINSGDAFNVLPDKAVLKGTVRCLDMAIRDEVERLLKEMVIDLPKAYGVDGQIDYKQCYPVTHNHAEAYTRLKNVATAVLGAEQVQTNVLPSMASEDFSFMLQAQKGAYFWLGVDAEKASWPLHNPNYDFNDDAIAIGMKVWIGLVESYLAK
ncbi:MAG: amidohydrolase [Neisseriaceae bacterium]|nr:amidohydrolase [Neisseriaceae bacterium]